MSELNHETYMRMALREADAAARRGETPTGCVIVRTSMDGKPCQTVIGRAHNQVELLKDPTAHAEMIAITQAASAVGDWRLTDTVLYVTKEPCAMCAGAIVLARIPRVVFGVADPKRGGAVSVFRILDHPDLNHRCEVLSGILADECRERLQTFFQARRAGKGLLSGPGNESSPSPEPGGPSTDPCSGHGRCRPS
jgi:tRNA(adenine34) deaminase